MTSFFLSGATSRLVQRFWLRSGVFALLFLTSHAWAISFDASSIGYHPNGSKLAVLKDVPETQNVEVVLYDPARRNPKFPLLMGAAVYKVTKMTPIPNKDQGPQARTLLLDFSDFTQPGTYELRVEGTDTKSKPLQINEFLYWDALKPVLKSFYFQRCGQDVDAKQQGIYHLACHLDEARLLDSNGQVSAEEKDVAGGWHNGGDYARYVTSTALSAARLMALYEMNPKAFKYFRMGYPLIEPGLGHVDDFHHEVKAGLDWLLAMQRRDGAVYRKVAGEQWPGTVMPEDDTQPRYVFGVSTQDTANFAAVMAMATRSFKKADLGYSVKTLLAAEKAWDFLQKHPKPMVLRSEKDFTGSGEFLDLQADSDAPYRLWAAAELYITTGKEPYHQAFLSYLNQVPITVFSWQNPAIQGVMDYLSYAPDRHEDVSKALKGRIVSLADEIAQRIEKNVWPSGLKQYPKSSNLIVAERAAVLLNAYQLTGQERYRNLASQSVQYLFGINPLGMTFVTGVGDRSVAHPFHRWMEVANKVLPGYMVDGPNEAPTDGKTPRGLGPLSYTDHAKAFSVNEATLLNNAALAYLLGALNHAYNKAQEQEAPTTPAPLHYELAPERPAKKGAAKSHPRK
jgi:endoglucanase